MKRTTLNDVRTERKRAAWVFLLVAYLFVLPLRVLGADPENPRCVYRSPLPDADLISPSTNLIMRFDRAVAEASLAGARLSVTGSQSGVVEGVLRLSDDGRTVIFRPASKYARGEVVQVTLAGGILDTEGTDLGPLAWRFFISSTAADFLRVGDPPHQMPEIASGAPVPPPSPSEARSASDDPVPFDFPKVTVSVKDTSFTDGIYLSNLVFDRAVQNSPYLMVLGESGEPLFRRRSTAPVLDFRRHENGMFTYFDFQREIFIVLDSLLNRVGTYTAGNGYVTDGHEFRFLPNGHVLLLAIDRQVVDMSEKVQGGNPEALVDGNIIQEVDRAGDVVFEWRSWDHFDILDATLTDFTASHVDPVHANAIEIDFDGNLLLSSRHLDEITKIDRNTGSVIWRLGGRRSYFSLPDDSLWFSHQHAIGHLGDGRYILFDNGNGHPNPNSRVIEFVLDTDLMTCRYVWEYSRPNTFGFAMGSVQRLPDGNTLIGWGSTNPTVTIVDQKKTILYELSFPEGVFSYRAYLLPWNLMTVDVPAEEGLPLNPYLHQNYPNPFNPTTVISSQLPAGSHVKLVVYDILGSEVAVLFDGWRAAGTYHDTFSARGRSGSGAGSATGGEGVGLASGVYLCKLTAGSYVATRKMVLMK